jgi:hypothetical protein
MKRLKKQNVNRKEFYPQYLKLVNVILPKPLTAKEIEILSAFMELEGDLVENDRFGTQARKLVREKFGFKKHSNIDNYIKYFKRKGILYIDDSKLRVIESVNIPKDEKEVELSFNFTFNNGKDR